jgi:hypothetical protein
VAVVAATAVAVAATAVVAAVAAAAVAATAVVAAAAAATNSQLLSADKHLSVSGPGIFPGLGKFGFFYG